MSLAYSYTTKSFAGHIVEKYGQKRWEASSTLWMQNELNKYKIGEEVSIVYTSKRPKRTENQNRYYWMYLGMIGAETGNDIDDLHSLFKGKFLCKEVVGVLGERVRRVESTTELTAGQFSDYIRRIEDLTGILAPPTEEYVLGTPEKIEYPEPLSEMPNL